MKGNRGVINKNGMYDGVVDFPGEYTSEEVVNLARLGLIVDEDSFVFHDGKKSKRLKRHNCYLT